MVLDKGYKVCREIRNIAPPLVLASDPEVRATPTKALALDVLPTELHFVRSHFGIPAYGSEDWTLEIDGAVERAGRVSLSYLKKFSMRTQTVVLECAGHRRNEFEPGVVGLQWGVGAISEARWTGISLSELLREASPTDSACEVLFEGADHGPHERGGEHEVPFARAMPLERALADDVLLAWEMNGHPIPPKHGAPLRLIVPGCYGVASVKWLHRISVLDHAFAGPFQTDDYQLGGEPLQDMRVNSLILEPADGDVLRAGTADVSGVAWGGRGGLARVEVRLVGGEWREARVTQGNEPAGFHRWRAALRLPPGELRLEVRAQDRTGASQPRRPVWNPRGYANNSVHGIRLRCFTAE